MKTLLILIGLAFALASCAGPATRAGEQAVLMHAASFSAPSGETLEQRQNRLMRVQMNSRALAAQSR